MKFILDEKEIEIYEKGKQFEDLNNDIIAKTNLLNAYNEALDVLDEPNRKKFIAELDRLVKIR